MIVSYTQRRTETVIYSPLKSRPALLLPLVKIVVELTYFRYDRLRSTKTHRIIMATMKTGMICHIRGSNDDCSVIGTRFDGLVFQTEMSENCYTLLLTLVQ